MRQGGTDAFFTLSGRQFQQRRISRQISYKNAEIVVDFSTRIVADGKETFVVGKASSSVHPRGLYYAEERSLRHLFLVIH